MVGVLSLLVALTLSLLITRVASMALMFTGLSRESARFQARSALTGCGFTTQESEGIVNHPVRRRIIMLLMLLGNIGVATVAATIMVSFMSTTGATTHQRIVTLLFLVLGLAVLFVVSSSRMIERRLNRVIAWSLKRFTRLEVRDYVSLLELSQGYSVTEMQVEPGDWLADKSLAELRLSDEGILILGIRPKQGDYFGTPRGNQEIRAGDTLIIYGNLEDIARLDQRRTGIKGDREHDRAVEKSVLAKSQQVDR
ncbi:MAG: TrkA C-terminal domain-containing protein [Planctomycetales bacterium]|nr:TrkA C-terminal domain-containing protein [Planctomycetales bacterium]